MRRRQKEKKQSKKRRDRAASENFLGVVREGKSWFHTLPTTQGNPENYGPFQNETLAALARDAAIVKICPLALLNFPPDANFHRNQKLVFPKSAYPKNERRA